MLLRYSFYVNALHKEQKNTVYKGLVNTCITHGMNLAETIKGVPVMY